jgi:hypothetical protein
MKKLILPPESGLRHRMQDLEYIQQGVLMHQALSISQHLPNNFSGIVIIEGCEIAKTGISSPYTYNLSAGKVFYKPATAPTGLVNVDPRGEILEVVAQTIDSTSAPQWELYQISERTGLRVFRSGEQYDVCLEFKMRLKTGSGLAQSDQVRRLEHIQFNKSRELYEIVTIAKLEDDNFLTDNFDSNGVGFEYKKYEGFEIATGFDKSVDFAGKTIAGVNFRDTDLANVRMKSADVGANNENTYFKVTGTWAALIGSFVGKWKHQLTTSELPPHNHKTTDGDNGGGGSPPNATRVKVMSGTNDSTRFDLYSDSSGGDQPHNNVQPSLISIIIQKVSEITY